MKNTDIRVVLETVVEIASTYLTIAVLRAMNFGRRVAGKEASDDLRGTASRLIDPKGEELEAFFDEVRRDVAGGLAPAEAIAKRINAVDVAMVRESEERRAGEPLSNFQSTMALGVELSDKAKVMVAEGLAPDPRPKRPEVPVVVTKRVL